MWKNQYFCDIIHSGGVNYGYCEKNEGENENFKIIDYVTNESITPFNIGELAQKFENDFVEFNFCKILGFSEMGHVMSRVYYDIDSLDEIADLPNPDINFTLNYVDKKTKEYSFALHTHTNTKEINCVIDKKKLARCDGK